MIGKAEWFQRRKYGGWGLTPKTWQGWAYTAAIVTPLIIFSYLPGISPEIKNSISITWVAVIIFDVIHIMANLRNDEREYKIEAIAERNSAWVMVTTIGLGVAYQAYQSASTGNAVIDPFLLATLFAGVVTKAISNLYYSRKSL